MRPLKRAFVFLVLLASASAARALPSLNPDVRQETIQSTICVPGYTATVRPSTVYTNGVKLKLVRAAGEDESQISGYELDHIVPLALGGHPRALDNLQLQPWPEARRKDRIEVKLQCLVCAGQIALSDAQAMVAQDWETAYHTYASLPCHRPRQRPADDADTQSASSEPGTEAPAATASRLVRAPFLHAPLLHALTIRAQVWWPFHFGSG